MFVVLLVLFFKENVSGGIYKDREIQKKETIYNEKKEERSRGIRIRKETVCVRAFVVPYQKGGQKELFFVVAVM